MTSQENHIFIVTQTMNLLIYFSINLYSNG